jgi:hypothetical protein
MAPVCYDQGEVEIAPGIDQSVGRSHVAIYGLLFPRQRQDKGPRKRAFVFSSLR